MALTTPLYPESLALPASATATTWGTLAASAALPGGVLNVPGPADNLFIQPFGTGADNSTFSFRLIGVSKLNKPAGGQEYRRTVLGEFACTLSADVGESGRVIDATQRYADTLVTTFGVTSSGIVSPANNVRGYLIADLSGFEFFYLDFKCGTATSANAVLRLL